MGAFYIPTEDITVNGIRSKNGTYNAYLANRSIYFDRNNVPSKRIYLNSSGYLIFQGIDRGDDGNLPVYNTQTLLSLRDRDWLNPVVYTDANLTVKGTKSRLVSTDQYSDRLLYCYETPSPLFGDVGEGVIAEDGVCYVWLDPVFAQTISTDQYQVFLQKYGDGDCWVSERQGGCFVVHGTPGLSFGWELKARQNDFDQLRLEKNDEKFILPTQTYGADAAQHIENIRKDREAA